MEVLRGRNAVGHSPVVNNGNIFVTGLDGNLYVFGTPERQAY
jgi:outer membrane protein assembly factor BamB